MLTFFHSPNAIEVADFCLRALSMQKIVSDNNGLRRTLCI
jgi:hypothetical protein